MKTGSTLCKAPERGAIATKCHGTYRFRVKHRVRANCEAIVEKHDEKNLIFATLTFADDIQDPREAQRRFNNFKRRVLDSIFPYGYTKTVERMKCGRLHYHLFAPLDGAAHSGEKAHWTERNGGKTCSNPSLLLREARATLRDKAEKYGFGRCEIQPIRKKHAIAEYVSKYVLKLYSNRKPEDAYKRFQESTKDAKRQSSRFSYHSYKARIYRLGRELTSQKVNGSTHHLDPYIHRHYIFQMGAQMWDSCFTNPFRQLAGLTHDGTLPGPPSWWSFDPEDGDPGCYFGPE